MQRYKIIFQTYRVVSLLVSNPCTNNLCITNYNHSSLKFFTPYNNINVRTMAQKSITAFFKTTPRKSTNESEGILLVQNKSYSKGETNKQSLRERKHGDIKTSPKKRKSPYADSESPKASKRAASPVSSDKKRKVKRQRFESSESESEPPTELMRSSEQNTERAAAVKLDESNHETYPSPKSKKAKGKQKLTKETSPPKITDNPNEENSTLSKDFEIKKENVTPKRNEKLGINKNVKNIDPSEVKGGNLSPESKENESDSNKSPSPTKETEGVKDKCPGQKMNPFAIIKGKRASAQESGVDEKVENDKEGVLVAEADYNPAKSKYRPVEDACWARGRAVPYLALAKTLEIIEATSARLKMVEILSNYFRSVLALTPEDLLPSIYLCSNRLAPAYHNLELGIAETYLMKAVGQCTGRSLAQVRAAAQRCGDLALAAERARGAQRTLHAPPPLTVRALLRALKDIALMTGQASVSKKINKIQSLFVACRHSEARYLIRSLEGRLRVGLAEQSLLQALALAAAATPPAGPRAGELDVAAHMHPEHFKARVDEVALIVKTTYCECPDYELIVPVLLQHGVDALPQHCRLTPGVPLKPMLAHPTKGVHEIFNRFEGEEFTCEYKYDGERAQIHVPAAADGRAPHWAGAAVFSRNQENTTSKYPDILSRLPSLLRESVTSCVLDCEAVAYDTAKDQILPFQVLATRKRKEAAAADVTVQVCVFVFDVLLLNGRALAAAPLAERRALLREHFQESPGVWQFARGRDCSDAEEVQQFLEQAVQASCEGLMVKALRGDRARYQIARRSRDWLKLKKDYLEGVGDTFDLVVIGAYRGKGKRAGAFGGFLMACYDPDSEEYQSICKLGTGFSDEDLKALSESLQQYVIDAPKSYYRVDEALAPHAWLRAARVWEVRAADVSQSPAHRAAAGRLPAAARLPAARGLALRFPRFVREREDKGPEQATSAEQVAQLYLAQEQVRAQGALALGEDDFY